MDPGQTLFPPQASTSRSAGAFRLAIVIVLVGLGTVALDILSGGDAVVTSLPVLLVAALWAMWVAPVRWSASVATLIALTIPISRDGEGHWAGALGTLGDLWQQNIDVTVPASHIKVSGFELVVLFLVVVVLHRRATGNDIDLRDRLPTAALLRDTAILAVVGLLFATGNGLVHGGAGQIVIWHVRPILRYLVLLAVYHAAYRGPRDYRLVAQIVVGAAAVRAVMAIYILVTVVRGQGLKIDSTTSHGDSVLFATAIVMLLAPWLETQGRRELFRRLPVLLLILYGAHANNRRLAWVELAFALVFILMVTPWVAWKRRALQTAVILLPVASLYVAAGWNSGSSLFAPVRTLRSVVDTKTDRSAWDREIEDWNLMMSMTERPILGRGFGFEYTEFIVGDDLSAVFPMYRSVPHNSVLGLLLFAGPVGFALIWSLFVSGVFLALRAYSRSTSPADRAAAMTCVGGIAICWLQAWGDLGLSTLQSQVVTSLALAMAGKLAVAVGAWPHHPLRVPGAWTPFLRGAGLRDGS